MAGELNRRQRALVDRLKTELLSLGLAPAGSRELATKLAVPTQAADAALELAIELDEVLFLQRDLYMLPEQLQGARQLAARLAAERPFSLQEFKAASGMPRAKALAVLMRLDAEGSTVREGDARRLATAPPEGPPQA